MFAPPFRPPDFVGSPGGLYDDLLFGGTECPIEARQRSLDNPRFKHDPRRLAVRFDRATDIRSTIRATGPYGGHE